MKQRVRLQKAIAQAGIASRRAAEAMILQGRVLVNGQTVKTLGTRVDPDTDEIKVDQQILKSRQPLTYLMFHKPKQCVTTLKDPQGRRTVLDFLPRSSTRLFPVGRLDYDAEGLLLITNDGNLAHQLQHPSYEVQKIYEVKVKGHPDEAALSRLRSGIVLDEGTTWPATVNVLRVLPKACWLRFVLHQGWYRQIKRMCEAVGHPVLKLKRIGYGPLRLGQLQSGSYRELTIGEVHALHRIVGRQQSSTPQTE